MNIPHLRRNPPQSPFEKGEDILDHTQRHMCSPLYAKGGQGGFAILALIFSHSTDNSSDLLWIF